MYETFYKIRNNVSLICRLAWHMADYGGPFTLDDLSNANNMTRRETRKWLTFMLRIGIIIDSGPLRDSSVVGRPAHVYLRNPEYAETESSMFKAHFSGDQALGKQLSEY